MPSPRAPSSTALLCAVACVVVAPPSRAQRVSVRAEVPIAVQGAVLEEPKPATVRDEDPGPTVRMLESSNVDRFLRRAQDFLAREDWPNAIKILQAVIEGRTVEEDGPTAVSGSAVPENPSPDKASPGQQHDAQPKPAATAAVRAWQLASDEGHQSVFSNDTRLFRPVQQLCHELLAALPPAGMAWYRAQFEIGADRELTAALTARDVSALSAIYDRYFLTRAAGKALRAAADLMMDQGRLRAAHQAYQELIENYPESLRVEAGIDDLWVRARRSLCLAMLGESSSTRLAVEDLRKRHADESLRIEGELVPVQSLESSAVFADLRIAATTTVTAPPVFSGPSDVPVPLFEVRFTDPQPYRPGRNTGDQANGVVFIGADGDGAAAAPKYTEFQPGTSILFLPGDGPDRGELAFLDHYRLTVIEIPSGRWRAATDLPPAVPNPAPGVPRVRIPAYDWTLLRVVAADDRLFTITGPGNVRLSGTRPLTRTVLEARRHENLALLWSTAGSEDLAEACFLAAPVVEGNKLFVPVMIVDCFWLCAIDVTDGKLLFRTPIHREGTALTKPPSVPVAIDAGTAYVLTNAGAVCAVDTLSGAIKWIRRYERSDPLRPRARTTLREGRVMGFGGQVFHEESLDYFAPTDLVLHDGLLLLAPTDGDQLICLDAANGETHWRCERGDMRYQLGFDGKSLFFGGSDSVTAIDFASGVRLWRSELAAYEGSSNWRGRGVLSSGMLIVPAERSLQVMRAEEGASWTGIPLPSFRLGLDPLPGPVNLFASGPWFAAVHSGGIELFSTSQALRRVADELDDPLRRAAILAQAGELLESVDALASIDVAAHPELHAQVSERMLALCSEIALAYAARGVREKAVEVLARARPLLEANPMIERWHLARIEMFHALGDLDAMSDEQQLLYKLMETGG